MKMLLTAMMLICFAMTGFAAETTEGNVVEVLELRDAPLQFGGDELDKNEIHTRKEVTTVKKSFYFDTFSVSSERRISFSTYLSFCTKLDQAEVLITSQDDQGQSFEPFTIRFGQTFFVKPNRHYDMTIITDFKENCASRRVMFYMMDTTPSGLDD